MKEVQIIESVESNKTEWLISLTDNNPEAKDCFIVSDSAEAFRIKKLLESWANKPGLKDNTGREIFEGDWCEAKFRDNEGIHVIQGRIFIDEFMWCLDNSHNNPKDGIYSINRLYDFKVLESHYQLENNNEGIESLEEMRQDI